MENILPIGSTISMSNTLFCIVGYADKEKNGKTVCGYTVVPYPLGYLNAEKVFFVPVDKVEKIISKGYENPSFEIYFQLVAKTFEYAEKISTSDLNNLIKKYQGILEKEKNNE